MNVVTFFVADSQTALLEQPCEDAFDHAAVFSQTAAVLCVSFGDVGRDAALSQRSANFLFGVIATIREGFVGSSPPSAARTFDGGNGVDQRDRLFGVMDIRAGLEDRQRCSVAVADHMTLRAVLAAIRGIGASLLPPKRARTEQLSNTALDQSMASASPSSSSNTCHTFCQTPATCQSRSRRQHVIPEPQPSSCGRNSHAQPVRDTNKIPVSAWRFGTRGRPPFGLGGSGGNNGSIRFHNSSESSALAISRSSMNGRNLSNHSL